MRTLRNPILPGFYPDPSICRVADTFYLAASSFNWFPGVPLFRSKNLTDWEPLGHALTRREQLDLSRASICSGIYAPSLRYHRGKFYVITTNVGGGGHFFVTAEDPSGPWSNPAPVPGPAFDPDLFFDEDGQAYFLRQDENRGICIARFDPATAQLLEPCRQIWAGFEDRCAEGPHLYRRGSYYHLVVAEGGTWNNHQVVVARSHDIYGPYQGAPHNPICTHRHRSWSEIQATGHADFVEDAEGRWWAVLLGTRPVGGYHVLGRETFLAPVEWVNDWPTINSGEAIPMETSASLPGHAVELALAPHEDLRLPLGPQWQTLNGPLLGAEYRRGRRRGSLCLTANAAVLAAGPTPAFIARRQQHHRCTFEVACDLEQPGLGFAGVSAFMDRQYHYDLALTRQSGALVAELRRQVGSISSARASSPLPEGITVLRIAAEPSSYNFSIIDAHGHAHDLGSAEAKFLSSEIAGGFTGVLFGLFAEGEGVSAEFSDCRYTPGSLR